MTQSPPETQWSLDVLKVVRGLKKAGVHEAPATKLFEASERVVIRVDGLEGVGVIHRNGSPESINLCVFEPSSREQSGFAEVFERSFTALNELQPAIEQWRAFRALTTQAAHSASLQQHHKWLQAVAKVVRKSLDDWRESERLRNSGKLEESWQAAGIDANIKQLLPADAPPLARERLVQDFLSIAPDLLACRLPREASGKWYLKRRVPLFRYDVDKRRSMTFCLLVALPEKRTQRPEIRAEWLQANQQTIRLDSLPEAFDTRVSENFAREVLGIDPRRRKVSAQAFTQVTDLQYQGKFEAAARLAGVTLDESIRECLQVRRVAHMCTCCAPLDRQLIAWSTVLTQVLIEINLHRVVALALRDQQRTQRRPHNEPIPLIPFPLQRHIRKAQIGLDLRDPSVPTLTISMTGSGTRLPLALWKRPVEVDLLRHELLGPADLPRSVRRDN